MKAKGMATASRKPGEAPTKAKAKKAWGTTGGAEASAIAAGIDAKLWQDAVIWVIEQGHGLVVTRTKDNTALHLTLLMANAKEKRVCSSSEALKEALEDLEDV